MHKAEVDLGTKVDLITPKTYENKSEATSPPSGCFNSAHQYLQEGVHLLLHPVDKPPLDHQTVAEEKEQK